MVFKILENFEMPYMPHGHCYYWDPVIMWSHAISDGFIALAYTSIPITLLYIYLKRKRDVRYVWMMILFAIFIFGCGLTHVMDVVNIWEPYYRMDSTVRIVTALASIGTAIVLIKIAPQIVAIPSADKWIEVNMKLNQQLEELKKKDITIASIKHFQLLTETLPQLVFTVDIDGKSDFYNDKWYQYTGLTYQESIWEVLKHVVDKLHQEDVIFSLRNSLENGIHFEKQFCIKSKENEYRWFLGRALPFRSGNDIIFWVCTLTDIHEEIKRKVELEKKNEELSRINNDLDTFIYTASHDLKHPISNLEGLLIALDRPSIINKPELQQQIKDMIHISLLKLKQTITDLSEVAKIQKNIDELNLTTINIEALLREIKEDISLMISESRAMFVQDLKIKEVDFSKKNLRSILYNLITNAIKYKHPERDIIIKISTYSEGNNFILSIEDNGLGIDMKQKEKLFMLFKRLHTHVEGTGIGLYIVKRIVDNYRGRIEVDSELNKGTVFRVYIPGQMNGIF